MLSIVLKEAQLALSVKKVAVLRLSQRNRSCLEVHQQAQRARIFFYQIVIILLQNPTHIPFVTI